MRLHEFFEIWSDFEQVGRGDLMFEVGFRSKNDSKPNRFKLFMWGPWWLEMVPGHVEGLLNTYLPIFHIHWLH